VISNRRSRNNFEELSPYIFSLEVIAGSYKKPSELAEVAADPA